MHDNCAFIILPRCTKPSQIGVGIPADFDLVVSRFTHDLAVLGNIVIAPITQNTVYRNLYGLAAADTGHIISIVVSSDTTGQVLCNGAQSAALGPGEVCIVRTVVPVSRVAFAAAVIVVGQSEGRFSDRLHLSCLLDN